MAVERFKVNSRKYDGTISRSWNAALLSRNESSLVLIGEFGEDVSHKDLGLIRKGTISYEYFWLDRWYNIFRFESPKGTLRNHYFNVNKPPVIAEGVVDYIDLDIDVVVWPNGGREVLDLDDFDSNAAIYGYTDEIITNARKALTEIDRIIDSGLLP